MSSAVTSREQIESLPAGAVLLIQQGDQVCEWVKTDDGHLFFDGASLGVEQFDAAISNGRAYTPADHPKGQWLVNNAASQYLVVLDVAHGGYTVAVFDSNARLVRIAQEPPIGVPWTPVTSMATAVRLLDTVVVDRVAAERLAKVIEDGTVPQPRDVEVMIRARGSSTVTPTGADAMKILGTEVNVTSVQPVQMEWTKEFPVTVSSRWECACREVEASEVEPLLPPGTATWIPVGCEVAGKRKRR